MHKQTFIKLLNERLEAVLKFKESELIQVSSIKKVIELIIEDAQNLEEKKAPETETELIAEIATLASQFESRELRNCSAEFVTRLRNADVSQLAPLTIDDIVEHVEVCQDDTFMFRKIDAIRSYREKHRTGLYETKVHIESFLEKNIHAINSALTEKWGMPIALTLRHL